MRKNIGLHRLDVWRRLYPNSFENLIFVASQWKFNLSVAKKAMKKLVSRGGRPPKELRFLLIRPRR